MGKHRSRKESPVVEAAMTLAVAPTTDDQALEALLAELPETPDDEVIEPAAETPIEASEPELEAAVASAEKIEAVQEHYAAQDGEAAEVAAPPAEAPPPEAAPEPAAVEAPKRKERTPRVTYAKQSDRIAARMGDKFGHFSALVTADADRDVAELKAEFTGIIDKMAKKVGEKAAMLLDYLKDGGDLNEVMARSFKVLVKDGRITSGDKGNVQATLLEKPYSIGTARSQANQIFCLFPALKITVKGEKGVQVPNPDSLILATVKTRLGL